MPGNRPLPSPSDEGKDGGFHGIIISHYVIVSKKENQIRCRYDSGFVRFLFSVWDKTTNNDRPQRYWQFLLTHPMWDGTHAFWVSVRNLRNFNSHIPCGMELLEKIEKARSRGISTRASRVWDGTAINSPKKRNHAILIHVPRGMDLGSKIVDLLFSQSPSSPNPR